MTQVFKSVAKRQARSLIQELHVTIAVAAAEMLANHGDYIHTRLSLWRHVLTDTPSVGTT